MEARVDIKYGSTTTGDARVVCSGNWLSTLPGTVLAALDRFARSVRGGLVTIDVSGIDRIDTAGMVLIVRFADQLADKGCRVELTGQQEEFAKMHALVMRYMPRPAPVQGRRLPTVASPFYSLGRATLDSLEGGVEFLDFIGESFMVLLWSLLHPASIRYRAIFRIIQDAGVRAIPITALTSFLIGVVIAYQGAVQLSRFGGNIFIVDMIGITVTRELAPLITAIVVAGRTGSSYTAQLGVMKITEEMDAMRVMGFDPHRFLVQPRIIGLMIALPLLIFFADIIGIAGGMFISHIHLDLSYTVFVDRLGNVLKVKHVWIGIIKGPFFAWLIAITGCFRGFQVSRNAESIGKYTTISVVNAIFLVIACDALFSVLLTQLGI